MKMCNNDFPLIRFSLRDDHLHTADHPTHQAHLYAMGVSGRTGQYRVNGPFRQSPGMLVVFLHNLHPVPGFDIRSFSAVHP